MSVSCVLVFPRLQSLLWVPDPSWCSPVPPWCSSDPSWCSPVPPWCSPDLSWRSPALSAPHWWAPALSAPRGGLLPCLLRTGGAPALSAPPWRSAVSLWWSSAPPWWSSAPVWWSSVPPALPQSPIPPLAHGPGPPSLPLFRLRSTTLLYCAVYKASGSRSLGGGSVTNPVCGLPPNSHQRSPLHHIDSHTTQHTGLHFPSSIALTTHTQLIALITLTPENYHTITITQSHTLYKPWTLSPSLPSIVCIYLSTSDSNLMEPFRVF